MKRLLAALAGLTALASPALAGCGDDPGPCEIEGGSYELALPDGGIASPPVVMFLHGAGGTGAKAMKNKRLMNALLSRGYAVVAPTGSRKFRNSPGFVWNFFPDWDGRDETQFLKDVADDAAKRFDLDRDRVLLAGFSAGAFMVTYLACDAPDAFAAYAPVSGGFWRPQPEMCIGPVRLFQTHGWSDKTVPLEGRVLGNGRFEQGDIFAGLELWRATNECDGQNPKSTSKTGDFMRRKWSDCADGSALEMALFSGGHKVPAGWSDMVLDWFEAQKDG
jgi:polyhydroxybutyrate depolymerase